MKILFQYACLSLLLLIFVPHSVFAVVISSKDIHQNKTIPTKFTLYGENISPQYTISKISASTKSLALMVEDTDANWVHYLVTNIPVGKKKIKVKENGNPGVEITNSFNYTHYGGPYPPKGSGVHHYYWRIYALNESSMNATDVASFKQEIAEHKIEEASFMGTYEKK